MKIPRKIKKGLKAELMKDHPKSSWRTKDYCIKEISTSLRANKNTRAKKFKNRVVTSFTLGYN